jgi:hypothetical protein
MGLVIIYGLLLFLMLASIAAGMHAGLPKPTLIGQVSGCMG